MDANPNFTLMQHINALPVPEPLQTIPHRIFQAGL
jgi:hypothetical protein